MDLGFVGVLGVVVELGPGLLVVRPRLEVFGLRSFSCRVIPGVPGCRLPIPESALPCGLCFP